MDIPIITITTNPMIFDSLLLILSFNISLSLAVFITAIRIGTATIPLIIALYTSALIGSIFVKFIHKPIIVEAAITR